MLENIFKYIGDIADAWIKLEEKIGLKKIILYVLLGFLCAALINFRTVMRNTVEFVTELNNELHTEKMEKRDHLISELYPLLIDYRSSIGADRVLYFEYHNTKENLVGIPFKYMDLVIQSNRYGVSLVPEAFFKDINVGNIASLYETLKRKNEIIYCSGEKDVDFINNYPGTREIFSSFDGSKKLAFINIPGVHQPIGLVVIEWLDEDSEIDKVKIQNISNTYVSGINALILSHR